MPSTPSITTGWRRAAPGRRKKAIWERSGVMPSSNPAVRASGSTQGPQASTTASAPTRPSSVSTPTTRSPATASPRTATPWPIRAPRSTAREAKAKVVATGSAYPEPGSTAAISTPARSSSGCSAASSSGVTASVSTPTRRSMATFRSSRPPSPGPTRTAAPVTVNPHQPPTRSFQSWK